MSGEALGASRLVSASSEAPPSPKSNAEIMCEKSAERGRVLPVDSGSARPSKPADELGVRYGGETSGEDSVSLNERVCVLGDVVGFAAALRSLVITLSLRRGTGCGGLFGADGSMLDCARMGCGAARGGMVSTTLPLIE